MIFPFGVQLPQRVGIFLSEKLKVINDKLFLLIKLLKRSSARGLIFSKDFLKYHSATNDLTFELSSVCTSKNCPLSLTSSLLTYHLSLSVGIVCPDTNVFLHLSISVVVSMVERKERSFVV